MEHRDRVVLELSTVELVAIDKVIRADLNYRSNLLSRLYFICVIFIRRLWLSSNDSWIFLSDFNQWLGANAARRCGVALEGRC